MLIQFQENTQTDTMIKGQRDPISWDTSGYHWGSNKYNCRRLAFNPLSANPTKLSNTLKQFVGNLRVFDHFEGLALKGLKVNDIRVRCWSNKKLLHHSQHVKNQLNS